MRVEVEIGTIQVDALPEGVTVDALRTAIISELDRHISSQGIPGIALQASGAPTVSPSGPASRLGFEIAVGIYGGLPR